MHISAGFYPGVIETSINGYWTSKVYRGFEEDEYRFQTTGTRESINLFTTIILKYMYWKNQQNTCEGILLAWFTCSSEDLSAVTWVV
jgi:hypothetical protein